MASELPEQSKSDAASGEASAKETPSLDWSEADLRGYLAQAWDQHALSHIKVIGRLRLAEKGASGFLEELHHPDSGARLPSPLGNSRANPTAFVLSSEVMAFQKRWGNETFALAELGLSLLEKRKERGDLLACMVRPGTLEPLSRIPESWRGIQNAQSEPMPLVLEKARQAIEDRLRRETSETEEELRAARSALESAVLEKNSLNDECKRVTIEVSQQAERIAALGTEFVQRRSTLEKIFRELEHLLKERGERMVALDLVDRADLEKLFPPEKPEMHEKDISSSNSRKTSFLPCRRLTGSSGGFKQRFLKESNWLPIPLQRSLGC